MLALIILDGYGIGTDYQGNAINAAHKPCIENMIKNNPTVNLSASGLDVGLPKGQMGNSEVGHTNIGAGRIVYQELTRISKKIENGAFYENKELLNTMEYVVKNNSTLHIMGLISDGGVHSHKSHLYALLSMAKNSGVKDICLHLWTDGRDVSPKSGIKYIEECESEIFKMERTMIATVSGRYYSMDRDNRWERINKAYDAIANAVGKRFDSLTYAIENLYDSGITDEFIVPMVNEKYNGMKSKDAVICFNFRPDRVREITRCFVDKELDEIKVNRVFPGKYLCFTQYDASISGVSIAFKPENIANTFGEYISSKGLKQLRIAETEKYAHVTFFFNGGSQNVYPGEDRILIPSPKVSTYDLKPEMSAYEVTDKVIECIEKRIYDVIILNYANCDMVGHTGSFSAAVKAVEVVDECLGRVLDAVNKVNGIAVVTADHGNAEKMCDSVGKPFTAHTTNPVPLSIVNYDCSLKDGGRLSDIVPTMLDILGFSKPEEMTGNSLIKK